jgi:hypothetical protein
MSLVAIMQQVYAYLHLHTCSSKNNMHIHMKGDEILKLENAKKSLI